jgi:hypothetical protein
VANQKGIVFMQAEVVALCTSKNKGERKTPGDYVMPKEGIFVKG